MKTITDTHLLLIDELAVIKEDNWVVDSTNYGLIHKVWEITETHFSFKDSLHARGLKSKNRNLKCHFKKIIAAHPHIEGVPEFEILPPNIEDDVEKLAESLKGTKYNDGSINKHVENNWQSCWKEGFIEGYKAKSETMFSLENMKKAMFEVYKNGLREPKDGKENFNEIYNRVIRTLTKPKQYEFIPELTISLYKGNGTYGTEIFRIINNKIQGVWKEITE